MATSEHSVEEILSRGVAEVIDREHVRARLVSGAPLRVKLGIDPTSPQIHLGRAVGLLKLRDLQRLGHTIVLIVGDFTGVIGDTSDKESERPMLSKATIEENMRTYTAQLGKLLDLSTTEVHYNSSWLEKLGYDDICEQANCFSLAEFSARENIKRRLDHGKRVSLREVLYPLMQGFDSVAVNADLEVGGLDQRFNLLAGRRLQEAHGMAPQDILMTNLIPGTDGRKMSASWGNTIAVTDSPNDMFGKVMSLADDHIVTYFVHGTRVPMEEVAAVRERLAAGVNPRDEKLRLASEVVTLYHGSGAAASARDFFVATVSEGKVPEKLVDVTVGEGQALVEAMIKAGFAESKSEARRKIEQGGVEVGGQRIVDSRVVLSASHDKAVLKVGKRDYARIMIRRSE